MGTDANAAPNVERRPEPARSREEVLAELERVVERAKSDWGDWGRPGTTVTDDLLPNRRKR
jgi:hypothetical protein